MRKRDKKIMKLYIISEMTSLLMEQRPELTMDEALSIIFNSETYEMLDNESTGLYYQSPRYVFSFLTTELETGKMG
jgi:hypothetical protein